MTGNLETLKPVEDKPITNLSKVISQTVNLSMDLLKRKFDIVVNFAAESPCKTVLLKIHLFCKTTLEGTVVLLDAAKKYGVKRYHQVSTDEVYGDLPLDRQIYSSQRQHHCTHQAHTAVPKQVQTYLY